MKRKLLAVLLCVILSIPAAGDGSDYPTSITLTLEQLQSSGLAAYKASIENGAEMLMTSATTFPGFDDEYLMADGTTKGYYPATLSHRIVIDMLRDELGFDGVVITDALEMDQFVTDRITERNCFPGKTDQLNMRFRWRKRQLKQAAISC